MTARIIATGTTAFNVGRHSPVALIKTALHAALSDARLNLTQIDGIVAVPSLSHPHFMEAHYIATQIGMLPGENKLARTIDTGGAGPISALIQAKHMVERGEANLVAVVAGDAIKSMPSKDFLAAADKTCWSDLSNLMTPVIPNGYDRVAQYQIKERATVSALMSLMASRHPRSLTKTPISVQDVLNSPRVGKVTSAFECARRADAGAAILVASPQFLKENGLEYNGVSIIGCGESSGPLHPPNDVDSITETMFSAGEAARRAYAESGLSVKDIDFFGLYDCFPVCLVRAVEAVGLAPAKQGGAYIQNAYERILKGDVPPQEIFPANTHGGISLSKIGLLHHAAPWEVPAMYNVIEAFDQLENKAGERQIKNASKALVYGNGGIFTHSAMAVLSKE